MITDANSMGKLLDNESDLIRAFIERGSEFTGQLAGAAIGGLVGGFEGLLVGAGAGVAWQQSYKSVALEVKKRILGDREEIRMAAGFTFALTRIQEKLSNGESLRNDDFFESNSENRSAANEILEGVLIASQREYEEKKVKFYGYMLANISFDNSITRPYANYLIRTCESLTYRQLCLLEIFGDRDSYKLLHVADDENALPSVFKESPYGIKIYHNINPGLERTMPDQFAEIRQLMYYGLVDESSVKDGSYENIQLTQLGSTMRTLMELAKLPKGELQRIAMSLITMRFPMK